jgi:hypothetical protein
MNLLSPSASMSLFVAFGVDEPFVAFGVDEPLSPPASMKL